MARYDSTMNVYLMSVFSIAVIAVVFSIALATTEVVRHRRLGLNRSATSLGEFGSGVRAEENVLEDLDGSVDHYGERIHHAVRRYEHGEGAVRSRDRGGDRGRARQRRLRLARGARKTSSRLLRSARRSQGGDFGG